MKGVSVSRMLRVLGVLGLFVTVVVPATGQEGRPASPADGHTIHVTAPHVVAGKVMGPYHHYCKVLSPEPVIECLCYESDAPGARLQQVEYIIAKSITRTGAVSLANWNKNWHDHTQEIATGRVRCMICRQTRPRRWPTWWPRPTGSFFICGHMTTKCRAAPSSSRNR